MANTSPFIRIARPEGPVTQDTLASRYPPWVRVIAMAAFSLAFLGWLNETWLFLWDSPIWLNRYTEYAIILGFGLWRIRAERNRYTRKRLVILVSVVTVFWWLIPWLTPFYEPYVGFLWSQPVFPSLHTPGTLTFLLTLTLVFLFGRRVICGFGCPCVGIRETVGFAYRHRTLRGPWIWRLRHMKWVFFVAYVGIIVATQFPPNSWTVSMVGIFGLVVGLTYFGSFFLIPLTGNRFYCRYLCPYGATFGLLNHAGFYGVEMDADRCIDCRRCEQACDMGIPVWEQGRTAGRVTGIEDCMGCARCVVSCPTDALAIRDVRNLFRPNFRRNATLLLGEPPVAPSIPIAPVERPPAERVSDWKESHNTPDLTALAAQAARCLDCGAPACRGACPLGNRIPDWLAAVAKGDIPGAATLAHETNPLPEVCGRLCPQQRLCEGACARGRMEGAVTIGAIEKALVDAAVAENWKPAPPTRSNAHHAAVIGAGPAGLACAERLNAAGWQVTVYDRNPEIGGLLSTGVPPFKLDKALLTRRREWLEAAGIEFVPGVEVDATRIQALVEEYDAVFLGTGASRPRTVDLPGKDNVGVIEALELLARVNTGTPPDLKGTKVLILGGGDTAMDCARSVLRLGARLVTVAYRGPAERLRASPAEVKCTREEGAQFLFEHCPVSVEGNERVKAVLFTTGQGERRVECDRVITAFGQQPDPPSWLATLGVALEVDGRIRVDGNGRTSHPRIYAGGDNTNGPDLVVTALAAGKHAAQAILTDRPRQVRKVAA